MKFLELVPKDLKTFTNEAKIAIKDFQFDGINIPDINRLEIRSITASNHLFDSDFSNIPHIPALTKSKENILEEISILINKGLKAVLIIKGEIPTNIFVKTYNQTSLDIIAEIKQNFNQIDVYAALDPYRQSLSDELNYCKKKINSGADGFFTQPFFDIQLAKIYLDQLKNTKLFMGVSPVCSERSYNYWINKNKAIFPSNFSFDFAYNAKFANKMLELVEMYQQHSYLMPITVNPIDYLTEIAKYQTI